MASSRAARLSRRRLLSMGAGIAGAVLLGGCDALSSEDDGGPSPTGSAGPGSRGRLDVRPRPQLPQSSDGELRLGGIPENSDELLVAEQSLLYSRLVGFDPRQANIHTDLARSIELVEPLVLRLRLDPSAHFHPDGNGNAAPVDADAIERDFQQRKAGNQFLFTEVIETIETPAADTLLIHLRAPFALLFELLSRADASIRAQGNYAGMSVPRGSGPFMLTQTGAAGRAFARNAGWHGGLPGLSTINMRFAVGDPELDAAFLRDEVDVRTHASIESRDAVAEREDAVRVRRASRRQRGLGLSLLGRKDGRTVQWLEAFQDDRVRRAISLGLDRPALLELDGSAMSGPVGPAHAGDALPPTELQTHPLMQHDPEEAQTLLAAAGAEGLVFRLQHLDSPGILPLVQLVVDQLREAGFAPEATPMADGEWETAFLRGDFQACVFELEALQTPDLGLRLHTSGGVSGLFSLWGYSNPVYDSAVREALSELDPAQRAERSREAQRLLLDEVPAMFPIASPREHATLSPRVRGWEFGAYEFNAGYLASTWTVSDDPEEPPL